MNDAHVFIGFDSKGVAAYRVFCQSIQEKSSMPVTNILPMPTWCISPMVDRISTNTRTMTMPTNGLPPVIACCTSTSVPAESASL